MHIGTYKFLFKIPSNIACGIVSIELDLRNIYFCIDFSKDSNIALYYLNKLFYLWS